MNNPSETHQAKRHYPKRQILTAYGPHKRVALSFPPEEGRTKQSFKDECDINVIMRRYEQTGVLDHVREARNAQFADVTGMDFQNAMDVLANARSAFEDLPARIRDRFDNDPAQLLDFIHDEENREEAAELGLLTPEAVSRLEQARNSRQGGDLVETTPAVPGAKDPAAKPPQDPGSTKSKP